MWWVHEWTLTVFVWYVLYFGVMCIIAVKEDNYNWDDDYMGDILTESYINFFNCVSKLDPFLDK